MSAAPPPRVDGDWLRRPGTRALIAALEGGGHRALFVGGAVRDALLGLPVGDVDLATDATPDIVQRLAEAAGLRVVPTGIAHGTVTVIAADATHEVTTFRTDVATDGRRATVAFTDDLAADAARRDFTLNALYADRDGRVIDPLGGVDDVRARRIRFVGDAAARIDEDALRILRFFRFIAQLGLPEDGIDADGLAASAALAERIAGLSRERIGAEMRKLLLACDPAPSLAAMAASGVLARVLPGADPRGLAPMVHLEAGAPAGWLPRLSVLGGAEAPTRFRLARGDARRLLALQDALGGVETAAVLGQRLGAEDGRGALLGRHALSGLPLAPDAEAEIARGAAARFPVRARDLTVRDPGLNGPALGAALAAVKARWLASDLRLGRDALLRETGS
jgi:poly(A) polymerase